MEDRERHLLTSLVQVGKEAFNPPVDSIHMGYPIRWEGAKFGTEQLIINYIEIFLLELIRKGETRDDIRPTSVIQENKQSSEAMKLVPLQANYRWM